MHKMSDWIRQASGRFARHISPLGAQVSEVQIQELSECLGLTRSEALEKLLAGETSAPPGHAGAGTGAPLPVQQSVAQKMNKFIRQSSGR